MRYLSIFAFVLVLVPSFATAGEPLTPRPLDPFAADAFASAVAQSSVVRSLVATLESSNVIVHIVSSRTLPMGIGGTTRFVTSRGGYRYVRITITTALSRTGRTTILGHELKHACEIAASEADDIESRRAVVREARAPHRRLLRNPGGDRYGAPDPRRAQRIAGGPSTSLRAGATGRASS